MDSYREIENLVYAATRLSDETKYAEMHELMDGCVFILPGYLCPPSLGADDWNEIDSETMKQNIHLSQPRLWGEEKTQKCFHNISNLEIYVNEAADSAHSFCRINVFQGVPEISFPIQSIGFGCYEDTFKRVDGKWHYATHKIDIEVMGDVSQHF